MTSQPEISTKDRIYEFIVQNNGKASFAEITQEFGEGDYEVDMPNNVVFWAGMTAESSAGVIDLLNEKRILPYPTSTLLYVIDGMCLNLPLVKRPPKNGYKEPHWLPVVLWTTDQVKINMKNGTMLTDPAKIAIYRDDGYDI